MKRNKLLLIDKRSTLTFTTGEAGVEVAGVQIIPGHFNEHVTHMLTLADAARLYLWLGEVVGKEVQP